MSKEYLEAFERLNEDDSDYALKRATKDIEIVKKALQRLEQIDNSNPSEAFQNLIRIDKEYSTITNEDFDICYDTIKKALLKAQEPKQYLKWEDLEFSFKEKYMKVKLNGNIYTLRYTRNGVMEFPVAYLEFNNTEITIIDCKKQFFNDLHLEVLNNE